MNTKTLNFSLILFALVLSVSFASSTLLIESVNQDNLYPGQEASLDVKVKNDFNYDVEDVRLTLIFNSVSSTTIDLTKPTQFSSVGSAQDYQDSIDEDDSETFNFEIRAANNLEPGNYNLGYRLEYKNNNNSIVSELGSIGVVVNSKTNLDFIAITSKPIVGMKDKLSLKIVNKGFGEVKFLSVQLQPSGFTLLSEDKVYVGSVSSDDYETADFDVKYTGKNANLIATVTYKDFENNDKTQSIDLPIKVYSQEEALKNGLITKSNAPLIVGVVVLVIVIWIIVRAIRKRNKRKKLSQNNFNGR
jgi:hypothetical protein